MVKKYVSYFIYGFENIYDYRKSESIYEFYEQNKCFPEIIKKVVSSTIEERFSVIDYEEIICEYKEIELEVVLDVCLFDENEKEYPMYGIKQRPSGEDDFDEDFCWFRFFERYSDGFEDKEVLKFESDLFCFLSDTCSDSVREKIIESVGDSKERAVEEIATIDSYLLDYALRRMYRERFLS